MAEPVRIRPGAVEWREVEGEIVALDLRTKEYLAVNRTGAMLWPSLVAGSTVPELLAQLATSFSVSPDEAAADLDGFLAELEEQDLLERLDDEPPTDSAG